MTFSLCNNNLDKQRMFPEITYNCSISNNDDGLILSILLRKKRDTQAAYVFLKR